MVVYAEVTVVVRVVSSVKVDGCPSAVVVEIITSVVVKVPGETVLVDSIGVPVSVGGRVVSLGRVVVGTAVSVGRVVVVCSDGEEVVPVAVSVGTMEVEVLAVSDVMVVGTIVSDRDVVVVGWGSSPDVVEEMGLFWAWRNDVSGD